mmetsp:Transcript_18835/g.48363  ORF Transcript_18835/g.48363 Transcript_18835/m.48363 type:complete len:230 (+) Transcript_18835:196-885(+)
MPIFFGCRWAAIMKKASAFLVLPWSSWIMPIVQYESAALGACRMTSVSSSVASPCLPIAYARFALPTFIAASAGISPLARRLRRRRFFLRFFSTPPSIVAPNTSSTVAPNTAALLAPLPAGAPLRLRVLVDGPAPSDADAKPAPSAIASCRACAIMWKACAPSPSLPCSSSPCSREKGSIPPTKMSSSPSSSPPAWRSPRSSKSSSSSSSSSSLRSSSLASSSSASSTT